MKYRLILKESVYKKKLYHLSGDSNLDKIVLKPRIPDQPIKGEDTKIPRISFAETIDGCLAGIFPIHPGTDLNDPRYTEYPEGYDFYVYAPIGNFSCVSNEEIIRRKLVPDATLSKEVWITSPVKVKKIGKIHVESFNPKTAEKIYYTMVYPDKNLKAVGIKFNWKWVNKNNLREDLGNTPKGYKDINKIMDYCNEWFENNPDKADKVIWKRHIQVRNWIRELKKYRSKFGPITFERKIDELKLNKEKKSKDGYITLDRAILMFFKRWKDTKYNMEDLNRDIMYCLIELRGFRKKFKKQEFSCNM